MTRKLRTTVLLIILICLVTAAYAENLIMPGAVLNWEAGTSRVSPGLSLKLVPAGAGVISWTSLEMRALFSMDGASGRLDLAWPGIAGFLYPGVSIILGENGFSPELFMDVDLFYFPFLLASIMLFEEPRFVPSLYIGPRFSPSEVSWHTGLRISYLHRRKDQGHEKPN